MARNWSVWCTFLHVIVFLIEVSTQSQVSTSAPLLSFPGNATLGSIVLQLSEAHHLPDDATVVGVQASAIPCSSPLPPSDHAFVFILSSSSKRRSPSACACNSLNTLLHSMMTDVSGLTVLVDPTDSELASAVDESKSTVYITDCCGQRCKQAGLGLSFE